MRNISFANITKFVSYNINMGEYTSSVDTQTVLKALAAAFETPHSRVLDDFNNLIGFNGDVSVFWPKLCASEFEVLVTLFEFVRHLDSDCPKGCYEYAENFVYFNLNTGSSVVWTHMVC